MIFSVSLGDVARQLFEHAGWSPGRRVAVPRASYRPVDDLALAVLSEVSGLRVDATGVGIECASGNVEFTDRYAAERASIVEQLFPEAGQISAIGEAHDSYIWLFINSKGGLMAFTEVDSKLYEAGVSVSQGVERLLLGRRWDYPCG